MSMIGRIISRLFSRRPVLPEIVPDPAVVAQVRAAGDYMQRYYGRLQEPAQPVEWATGGPIAPGDYDSGAVLLPRREPVTDR